jgi:hypothetical protein
VEREDACVLRRGVIDSVLWYTSGTGIYAEYEVGFVFTSEELRQADIFACLDEAECARLAHTIADLRLEPGEWLFREGAPASFYVLLEGCLRIVLDVHGKQTEIAEHEFKQGDFLGEVPLLLTITRKRRNLDICRCLATGPSFRYGQFSPALHKSKSSGLRSDCKQLRHDSRILVCHSVLMTLKTPDV